MIKILLVDDHVILRTGLKTIIQGIDRFEIVGEASNGIEGLAMMAKNKVDVVLTDIQMPEMNGIEFTKEILRLFPDTKVIAVSMHSESYYVRNMLNVGATGYILKDASESVIVEAIDSVLQGNNYYGYEIERTLMEEEEDLNTENWQITLSQRELDVLKLIINEKSNSEIASELFISIRTVDAHRRNLLKKTGCKNTVGLTKYALKYQLV